MAKYIIEGGHKLSGSITLSGNKNATFPCIAASLLTSEEVTLENIPEILDVEVMTKILGELGVKTQLSDKTLKIEASKIVTTKLPEELTTRLRGSVVLAGALLSRMGQVEFAHPGGDVIGQRSIDVHLEGFVGLGYQVKRSDRKYLVKKDRSLTEKRVFLEVPSVTGTENLILASVLNKGTTSLRNCAQEPHIVDLCRMLSKMGAKIDGIGSSNLQITGVDKLNGVEYHIGSDEISFGTYAAAAAVTRGKVLIKNCQNLDCEPIIKILEKIGVEFKISQTEIEVSANQLTCLPILTTGFWPGFPTDLMSVMIVLATQARGVSLLRDWVYESRMFFVDKLIAMGANITIADPHRVVVYGPTNLKARNLESPDIRAGMALVLASLVAEGKSTIGNAELIERGYENVVENLTALGAKIERID